VRAGIDHDDVVLADGRPRPLEVLDTFDPWVQDVFEPGFVESVALAIMISNDIVMPFVLQRRWFWLAAPAIALLTVPWLALARRGYGENLERAQTISQCFARFIQYLIECASITPLIGCIILLAICLATARRHGKSTRATKAIKSRSGHQLPEGADSAFLLVAFATLLGYAVAIGLTESCDTLWRIGIRYTPGMIPLMAMVAGILIVKVARGRIAIWLPLFLIFGFTNLVQLAPWLPWGNQISMRLGNEVIEAHLPTEFVDRLLPIEQLLFLRDLRGANPGTIATSCAFLNQHAKPGDRLLVNYCAEPCYFYTRLPQVLRILPDYPVYEAARRKVRKFINAGEDARGRARRARGSRRAS
jgi:hypothetical protein